MAVVSKAAREGDNDDDNDSDTEFRNEYCEDCAEYVEASSEEEGGDDESRLPSWRSHTYVESD